MFVIDLPGTSCTIEGNGTVMFSEFCYFDPHSLHDNRNALVPLLIPPPSCVPAAQWGDAPEVWWEAEVQNQRWGCVMQVKCTICVWHEAGWSHGHCVMIRKLRIPCFTTVYQLWLDIHPELLLKLVNKVIKGQCCISLSPRYYLRYCSFSTAFLLVTHEVFPEPCLVQLNRARGRRVPLLLFLG